MTPDEPRYEAAVAPVKVLCENNHTGAMARLSRKKTPFLNWLFASYVLFCL